MWHSISVVHVTLWMCPDSMNSHKWPQMWMCVGCFEAVLDCREPAHPMDHACLGAIPHWPYSASKSILLTIVLAASQPVEVVTAVPPGLDIVLFESWLKMFSGPWWTRGGGIGGEPGPTEIQILGWWLFSVTILNFTDGESKLREAWKVGGPCMALGPETPALGSLTSDYTWNLAFVGNTICLCWASAQSQYLFFLTKSSYAGIASVLGE